MGQSERRHKTRHPSSTTPQSASPAAEVEFCRRALDAVLLNERPGPDGAVAHALLQIGPAMIMIETEWPSLPNRAPAMDGSSPVVIFVYVPDVDATLPRAVERGATVVVPAQDQFWGDRTAWIVDPAGHVWTTATRIERTTAEQRTQRGGLECDVSGDAQ